MTKQMNIRSSCYGKQVRGNDNSPYPPQDVDIFRDWAPIREDGESSEEGHLPEGELSDEAAPKKSRNAWLQLQA